MDEYEELVRSLVTERFSRWRPPSANGVQMGYTEHASADMDSPSTSVTAEISAQIHDPARVYVAIAAARLRRPSIGQEARVIIATGRHWLHADPALQSPPGSALRGSHKEGAGSFVLYPLLASRTLRMVATDLDGTIIPHGQGVSARTRAAMQACTKAGVRVVFVTGRPPRWLTPVVEATGHKGFAICANGSITLDLESDSIVALHSITNQVATEVARRLRVAVPDVVFAVETPLELRAEWGYEAVRGSGRGEGLAPDPQQVGARRQALRLEELLDDEPLIKMIALSSRSTPDELLAAGRAHVADLVTPTHSSPTLAILEMGPRGVTKGSSLADLARTWGIAPADVVTFGDMPNDIEMLTWSGTSYAMSGGHPDAISAADHLAPKAGDDGVAQVLEHMLQ